MCIINVYKVEFDDTSSQLNLPELCLFIANLTSLTHQLLVSIKQSITWNSASLPVAFVVGPLVLPREKYTCHTMCT